MVKRLVSKFKMKQTSTSDEPHSGCFVEVSIPEVVEKILRVALEDRKLNYLFESVKAVNISKEMPEIFKLIF